MEANVRSIKVKRNEIWYANLGETDGSEQAGRRPVLIVQNNIGNRFSPTVIVASITDAKKKNLPTHVYIKAGEFGFFKDSAIMFEQLRTIDKSKLIKKMGALSAEHITEADIALSISLSLGG